MYILTKTSYDNNDFKSIVGFNDKLLKLLELGNIKKNNNKNHKYIHEIYLYIKKKHNSGGH